MNLCDVNTIDIKNNILFFKVAWGRYVNISLKKMQTVKFKPCTAVLTITVIICKLLRIFLFFFCFLKKNLMLPDREVLIAIHGKVNFLSLWRQKKKQL